MKSGSSVLLIWVLLFAACKSDSLIGLYAIEDISDGGVSIPLYELKPINILEVESRVIKPPRLFDNDRCLGCTWTRGTERTITVTCASECWLEGAWSYVEVDQVKTGRQIFVFEKDSLKFIIGK